MSLSVPIRLAVSRTFRTGIGKWSAHIATGFATLRPKSARWEPTGHRARRLLVLAGSCSFLLILAGPCELLPVLAGRCSLLPVLAGFQNRKELIVRALGLYGPWFGPLSRFDGLLLEATSGCPCTTPCASPCLVPETGIRFPGIRTPSRAPQAPSTLRACVHICAEIFVQFSPLKKDNSLSMQDIIFFHNSGTPHFECTD